MSSSDETYLEGFIEGLTNLPNEVRRNLDLMKDLDKSSGAKAEELWKLQEQYLQHIQQQLSHTRVVVVDNDEKNDDEDNDETNHSRKKNKKQKTAAAAASNSSSSTILGLQLLQNPTRTNDKDKDKDKDKDTEQSNPFPTTTSAPTPPPPEEAFLPTRDELFDYTYHPVLYHQIQKSQQECLQKAEEKVAVAQQTYELIDANVQRLDRDLAAMETLLQATGEFDSGALAKPDDLAACQVSPGSEWILAKVLNHDPQTDIYQLADEDVESNKIFHLPAPQVKVLHSIEKLRSGDTVYAVYPDTTSFYQATVVQAPRRQGSTGASFVMVQFQDDADEFGITHDKAIPLKHVMPPP